jgi:hypothetical protein
MKSKDWWFGEITGSLLQAGLAKMSGAGRMGVVTMASIYRQSALDPKNPDDVERIALIDDLLEAQFYANPVNFTKYPKVEKLSDGTKAFLDSWYSIPINAVPAMRFVETQLRNMVDKDTGFKSTGDALGAIMEHYRHYGLEDMTDNEREIAIVVNMFLNTLNATLATTAGTQLPEVNRTRSMLRNYIREMGNE